MTDEDLRREVLKNIEGSNAIVDYFGIWPSFHDSEIIELHLDRRGSSWLRVLVANDGYRPSQKQGIVTFHFKEVLDLELCDFSNQNVIFGLTTERTGKGYKISLSPCYGLSGWLEVSALTAEVLPEDSN